MRKKRDFEGSSNMMESEVIKRNLSQIDCSKMAKNVPDQDFKTRDLMAKSVQYADANRDLNYERD